MNTEELTVDNPFINLDVDKNSIFISGKTPDMYGKLVTQDVLEAVCAVSFSSYVTNNHPMWNISLAKCVYDKQILVNSLYWLSGGDNFWKSSYVNCKWSDVFDCYYDRFGKQLENTVTRCKTLLGLKRALRKRFNASVVLEYTLSLNILSNELYNN